MIPISNRYEMFKARLAAAGYNYGDDAAGCAFVGYELAQARIDNLLATIQLENEGKLAWKKTAEEKDAEMVEMSAEIKRIKEILETFKANIRAGIAVL